MSPGEFDWMVRRKEADLSGSVEALAATPNPEEGAVAGNAVNPELADLVPAPEIGRASCRERV